MQSAIEFLTTYSFVFLVIGIVIGVLAFLTTAPAFTIPSQCSAASGPDCNFIQVYANQSVGYSLATMSLTNSQNVPINVTNTIVTLRGKNFVGYCTPSFLYPGMQTTCTTKLGGYISIGTLIQGFYQLNALFCNSNVANLSISSCNYEQVDYGGAFATTPMIRRAIVFSVAAVQAPNSLQLLPFSVIGTTPHIPTNFSILQNGDWVSNVSGGTIAYAYATNTPLLGNTYLGYKTQGFPATLSALSNNNIQCSSTTPPSYNSILSAASTTLYFSTSNTFSISIDTGGAAEVFYKAAAPGNTWHTVFSGTAWKSQSPTSYGPTGVTFNGLYNLIVLWMNPCGGGVQVFKGTGVPS